MITGISIENTALKKQLPPPPTSIAVLPTWDNLVSNRDAGFIHDELHKGLQVCSEVGPGFNSTSPLNDIILLDKW